MSEKDTLDTHKSYLRQIASIFRSEPDSHHLSLSSFISTSQLVHDEWKAVESTISRLIYDRYDAHIASEWIQSLQSSILTDSSVDDCVTNLLKANVDITLFAISVLLIGSEAYNVDDALRGVAGGTRSSTHIGNPKTHFHQDAVRGSRAEIFEMIRDKPDLNHHFGRSDDRSLSSFTENLSHPLGSSERGMVHTSLGRTTENAEHPTIPSASRLTEISGLNRSMGLPAPNMTGSDEDHPFLVELNDSSDFAADHQDLANQLNTVYKVIKDTEATISTAIRINNVFTRAVTRYETLPADIRMLLYMSADEHITGYDRLWMPDLVNKLQGLHDTLNNVYKITQSNDFNVFFAVQPRIVKSVETFEHLVKLYGEAVNVANNYRSLDGGNPPPVDFKQLVTLGKQISALYPFAKQFVEAANHPDFVHVLDGLTWLDKGQVERRINQYMDANDLTPQQLKTDASILPNTFYENFFGFIQQNKHEIDTYEADIVRFNDEYWKGHEKLQEAFKDLESVLNGDEDVHTLFPDINLPSDGNLQDYLHKINELYDAFNEIIYFKKRLEQYTPEEIGQATRDLTTALALVAGRRADWPDIEQDIQKLSNKIINWDNEFSRFTNDHGSLLKDLTDFSQNKAEIMQRWTTRLKLWIMNSLSGWPRVSRFLFGD